MAAEGEVGGSSVADGATSHLTRLPKDDSQVIGYVGEGFKGRCIVKGTKALLGQEGDRDTAKAVVIRIGEDRGAVAIAVALAVARTQRSTNGGGIGSLRGVRVGCRCLHHCFFSSSFVVLDCSKYSWFVSHGISKIYGASTRISFT